MRRARRRRRKAPQQNQQWLCGLLVGFTVRQHPLNHPPVQFGRASGGVDKSSFITGFERNPKRGKGGFRQSGAGQQRLHAGASAAVQQRRDACLRQTGQLR